MNPLTRCSRWILLGPPCCGKGTLAQQLVDRSPALQHISTGEIFRAHVQQGTPFGQEIEQCMQEGKLIPDELVTTLTLKKLRSLESGFILDGFPRTLQQAKALETVAAGAHVVHLDASDQTVIGRLAGRISCGSCGAVFNTIFGPPKLEGQCDSCDGELIKRSDDTREVAVQRLEAYHAHAESVLKFYREKGAVTTIETGDLKPHEIFRSVVVKLT